MVCGERRDKREAKRRFLVEIAQGEENVGVCMMRERLSV